MLLTKVLEDNDALPSDNIEQIEKLEDGILDCDDEEFTRRMYLTLYEIIGDDIPKHVQKDVFSRSKDFSRDPIIGNIVLNERGLHAFRVVYSYYASVKRYQNYNIYKKHPVREEGIFVIPSYFPQHVSERLSDAVDDVYGSLNKQPHTIIANQKQHAELKKFNSTVAQTIGDAATYKYTDPIFLDELKNNTFVQRVINQPDDDEQKDIHSDIFFPAVKFWWFPRAVGKGQGTFRFAKFRGLTPELVDWHYSESIAGASGKYPLWKKRGHREGSLRIDETELIELGMTMQDFDVPQNTMVIANVFGFHCRANVKRRTERVAIHGSIRHTEPFKV